MVGDAAEGLQVSPLIHSPANRVGTARAHRPSGI